jgi:hypothetical protein
MGVKNVLQIFLICNYRFKALSELSACHHDHSMATQTLKANIGPKTQNFPLMTATRVRLPQTYNIVHLYIGQHADIISYILCKMV